MMQLYLPFRTGTFWRVGSPGSFYGEGYHSGADWYALDFNQADRNGNLIQDLGEPLLVPADGKVVQNYVDGYGGIGVVIEHEGGYRTKFHHLQYRSGLPVGRLVKRGDELGLVGSTGLSSGPHLHFVFSKNGQSLPPSFVGYGELRDAQTVEVRPVQPPVDERKFWNGLKIIGGFKWYWENRGGLDIFGYPLTDELKEDGRTCQYFERAVFEYWPENSDPYTVLLRRLGADALAERED